MTVVRQEQNASVKFSLLLLVLCAALFTTARAQAQAATPPTPPSSSAPATEPTKDTTAAAPAAAAATPPAAPTWSVGPIDFSGLVDGYYNFNANHPNDGSGSSSENQLRNFDVDSNAFSLSMAKLTLSHDPDPIGFRVDLMFGKTESIILGTEPNFKYLEQAFVSWKPTKGHGFEADFGEFVTSAGAEVIESKDNWNYSRSLLFSWAIPYYHVGLRTSMPITKAFTGGFQVVNGWNNFTDNNSGKTVGITGVYTKTKFTWSGNYYTGPENSNTNVGFRNLLDTTLLLTPSAKFNAYINYDYVQNRNAVSTTPIFLSSVRADATSHATTPAYIKGTLDHLQGIAAAARFQATSTIAFAGRYEYLGDGSAQGANVGTPSIGMGTHNKFNEFTLTGEYKIPEGLLFRVEYRRDGSDQKYFLKGTSKAVQNQSTAEVGIVAFFGPKR
jgi:hypothetical protein